MSFRESELLHFKQSQYLSQLMLPDVATSDNASWVMGRRDEDDEDRTSLEKIYYDGSFRSLEGWPDMYELCTLLSHQSNYQTPP